MTPPVGYRSKQHYFDRVRAAARSAPGLSGIAALLAAILATLGILANVLQLITSGSLWAWLAVAAVVAITLLVLLSARPLLSKNFRGIWLFNAVGRTGLIDVEDRGNEAHRVPPTQIFTLPHVHCILITGILDQLFQKTWEEIAKLTDNDGEVRILLLHPKIAGDSLKYSWVRHRGEWMSYWKTNCNEAQIAVDAIIQTGVDKLPGLHLKFMRELPPYFGILAANAFSSDSFGSHSFVRIQPLTHSKLVGRGTVVTFKNMTASPFQYFAEDLLSQWEAATEDRHFVQERRRALGL